ARAVRSGAARDRSAPHPVVRQSLRPGGTRMSAPITRADILSLEEYAKQRDERRRRAIELKRHRRVPVGPFATFYFENRDTMLQQIHEMLWIEKGGEEQIADELS